jgi:hypothetical protein
VSKDLTGSNAVCCGKPLRLQCKAKGRPQPTYSWYLNGRELRYVTAVSDFVAKGGILTIPVPLYKKHQGEYRCLASNAWGAVLSRPVQVKIIGKRLVLVKTRAADLNLIYKLEPKERVCISDKDRMRINVFILFEDDFEIKSKIYSFNLRLVLNHILYFQYVLSFWNLFFTLLTYNSKLYFLR